MPSEFNAYACCQPPDPPAFLPAYRCRVSMFGAAAASAPSADCRRGCKLSLAQSSLANAVRALLASSKRGFLATGELLFALKQAKRRSTRAGVASIARHRRYPDSQQQRQRTSATEKKRVVWRRRAYCTGGFIATPQRQPARWQSSLAAVGGRRTETAPGSNLPSPRSRTLGSTDNAAASSR